MKWAGKDAPISGGCLWLVLGFAFVLGLAGVAVDPIRTAIVCLVLLAGVEGARVSQ